MGGEVGGFFVLNFISLVRFHKVRRWISLTFLEEDTNTSLPLKRLISVNRLSFPNTLISQLDVLPNSFFARFSQTQYAAGNTAIRKPKLQSHVPLLYSSSTCYLTAKISKLAYSKPVSREHRQGLVTKATDKTIHSCKTTGAHASRSLTTAALLGDVFPQNRTCLVHTTDYGNTPSRMNNH